jgi:starvation-inducible DNA-binding protein
MSARTVIREKAIVVYPTHNDLPKEVRNAVIEILDARLADAVDLETQMKQAHWNVKGPDFISLHKLFDEVYEDIVEYVDLLAERVVQLGGVAHGTARQAVSHSTLSEYPAARDGHEHIEAVSAALAAFGKSVRAAIDRTDQLGDKGTADLFTEVSRGVDKQLWFVEAHLHAER